MLQSHVLKVFCSRLRNAAIILFSEYGIFAISVVSNCIQCNAIERKSGARESIATRMFTMKSHSSRRQSWELGVQSQVLTFIKNVFKTVISRMRRYRCTCLHTTDIIQPICITDTMMYPREMLNMAETTGTAN